MSGRVRAEVAAFLDGVQDREVDEALGVEIPLQSAGRPAGSSTKILPFFLCSLLFFFYARSRFKGRLKGTPENDRASVLSKQFVLRAKLIASSRKKLVESEEINGKSAEK